MTKTWAFIGLLVLGLAIQDVKAAEDKAPEDLKPDTADANLGASRYDLDHYIMFREIFSLYSTELLFGFNSFWKNYS